MGHQGRSGRKRKISPPPEFDPWTVQPAASRYSDCATPARTFKTTYLVGHTSKQPFKWECSGGGGGGGNTNFIARSTFVVAKEDLTQFTDTVDKMGPCSKLSRL